MNKGYFVPSLAPPIEFHLYRVIASVNLDDLSGAPIVYRVLGVDERPLDKVIGDICFFFGGQLDVLIGIHVK